MPSGAMIRVAAQLKLLTTVTAPETRAENVWVRLREELLDCRLFHAVLGDDRSLLQRTTCHLTFEYPQNSKQLTG